MAVENNDLKLIDHQEYTASVHFSLTKQAEKEMEVTIERYLGSSEKITIRSQ
jgi:hypothetical protein